MARLIDADVVWRKLQYRLKRYGNEHMSEKLKEMLDSIPTAYNVSKVVAELEKIEQRCLAMLDYQGRNAISDGIVIVKRGGVE